MNSRVHASYTFLIYNIICWFWFNFFPTGIVCILIILFGLFSDIDVFFWIYIGKGKIDQNFQHHLYFWIHWPISYFLLKFRFFIPLTFNFFPEYFLVPLKCICLYKIFDSISCGDVLCGVKSHGKKNKI